MKNRSILIIFIGAAVFTGCAANNISDSPTLLTDYSSGSSAGDNKAYFPSAEKINQLTLPKALALTVENNHELKGFSYDVRAAEARLIQAGVLPNPEVSFAVEDVWGTGGYSSSKQSQSTLQLSQVIELGGKRSARVQAASAASDYMKDSYEIKRVEILSDVTDKFIRVAADEHLLKLAEKAEDLAKRADQNIRKRVQAGVSSELEASKSRVLLSRASIAKEHAEHELEASKMKLASFWGSSLPNFEEISASLFSFKKLPDFETLVKRIDQSIEIKRWVNERRLREAEHKVAVAKSVPDLTIGAGPRRLETSGDNAWVFQVSMPLPLFDTNQGGRLQTQALLEKVPVEEEAARLRLKTALFGLYQEMRHAKTEMQAMNSEIIPQAERSLKLAEQGYEQGRLSYLELIDTQRTLLEVYRENIEASYRFHQFINAIERLIGSPLTEQG